MQKKYATVSPGKHPLIILAKKIVKTKKEMLQKAYSISEKNLTEKQADDAIDYLIKSSLSSFSRFKKTVFFKQMSNDEFKKAKHILILLEMFYALSEAFPLERSTLDQVLGFADKYCAGKFCFINAKVSMMPLIFALSNYSIAQNLQIDPYYCQDQKEIKKKLLGNSIVNTVSQNYEHFSFFPQQLQAVIDAELNPKQKQVFDDLINTQFLRSPLYIKKNTFLNATNLNKQLKEGIDGGVRSYYINIREADLNASTTQIFLVIITSLLVRNRNKPEDTITVILDIDVASPTCKQILTRVEKDVAAKFPKKAIVTRTFYPYSFQNVMRAIIGMQ